MITKTTITMKLQGTGTRFRLERRHEHLQTEKLRNYFPSLYFSLHICYIHLKINLTGIQCLTNHLVSQSHRLKLSQLGMYKECNAIRDLTALFKTRNQTP